MALTRDELVERFEVLAKYDPGMGINLCRIGANTVVTLAAGPAHPESSRRFWDLAVDAVALFDPDGTGDETERWLRLVCDCVPNRIAHDVMGGMIHNAAEVSALAVRRLGNSDEADHQPKAPVKRKPIGGPLSEDQPTHTGGLLSHPDLVSKTHLTPKQAEALRGRLFRWRKAHRNGEWIELPPSDRRSNKPKYLYKPEEVQPLIRDIKRKAALAARRRKRRT